MIARGIRNNNPGNIRKSSTTWQGMAVKQPDPEFLRFVTMAYGIRAMVKVIHTYQTKYKLSTVRQIIGRWAPPTENDTEAYINTVAKHCEVDADAQINTFDAITIFQLVRAIIIHESGRFSAMLISDPTVWEGIHLADV